MALHFEISFKWLTFHPLPLCMCFNEVTYAPGFASVLKSSRKLIQGIFIIVQDSVESSFRVLRVWQQGLAVRFAKSIDNRDCIIKCKIFHPPDSIIIH